MRNSCKAEKIQGMGNKCSSLFQFSNYNFEFFILVWNPRIFQKPWIPSQAEDDKNLHCHSLRLKGSALVVKTACLPVGRESRPQHVNLNSFQLAYLQARIYLMSS